MTIVFSALLLVGKVPWKISSIPLSSKTCKGDARGLGRHIWDVPAAEVFASYKVIDHFLAMNYLLIEFSTDVKHRRVDILTLGSPDKTVVFVVLHAYLQPETSAEADHRRCHVPSLVHLHRLILCQSVPMYTN